MPDRAAVGLIWKILATFFLFFVNIALMANQEPTATTRTTKISIDHTIVEYDETKITEMQCRLYCAHRFGLSDWNFPEFCEKLDEARRKLVLSSLLQNFFSTIPKFFGFFPVPKLSEE